MPRTTVVHISTIGSTAVHLLMPQCRYLREHGYEISFVFSPDEGTVARVMAEGFHVHTVSMARTVSAHDSASIWKMARYLKRLRPDVVHTHTSKAGAIGRVAARIAGVPCVIHTIHGFPFIEGQNRVKYEAYAAVERQLSRWTDVLLSQSLEDVETARRLGIWARTGQPIHIGNGIDLARFDPQRMRPQRGPMRASFGLRHSPVIVCVGRLTLEKGYVELTEALGQLADLEWSALYVGPDEGAAAHLANLARKLGVADKIHFLGERGDIEDILSAADVFVLASHREGVPRSVIEAQAMTLPVVATRIRGCREVVVDGETGFLVPLKDSGSLAAALKRLLGDERLRARMGAGARRRVETHFDENNVFERILQVYEMVRPV